MKLDLSTHALFGKLSEVTTFLGAIYSLRIMTCLAFFSYLEIKDLYTLASVSSSLYIFYKFSFFKSYIFGYSKIIFFINTMI